MTNANLQVTLRDFTSRMTVIIIIGLFMLSLLYMYFYLAFVVLIVLL